MTLRPGPFSRRFVIVLRLAFHASARRALKALYTFLSGKRVRGWNLLCAIAAENPGYYARWISETEPGWMARWLSDHSDISPVANPVIAAILETQIAGDLDRTRHAVLAAFGPTTQIVKIAAEQGDWSALRDMLRSNSSAWFFPIVAGDLVSAKLGTVVAHLGAETRPIYWDEDRLIAGERNCAWAKPEWDPVLFGSQGGLLGAALLRAQIALNEWESAGRGLEDEHPSAGRLADLCLAAGNGGARHVPLILTHRAARPVASAQRDGPGPLHWPSVSIIIPTRDLPDHLLACLRGLDLLDYQGAVETIIVDNGSTDPAALELLAKQTERAGTYVLRQPGPFNFSQLNNEGVRIAKGELLCFLNNDIEPLNGSWLTKLAEKAVQPDVGAVGAMLLYPDGSIQHAGVAIGIGGAAGHVQKGTLPDATREDFWYVATRRVSAVTAACLVVGRDKFLSVGGFDERAFPVAFNDVDLCLKLDSRRLRNLFVAEAQLIHHESKSRGQDDNPEKRERFASELEQLRQRWQTQSHSDPWHSPLFSRVSELCLLQI